MDPDAADYWLQAERNLARAQNDFAHAFFDGATANAQQAAELALKAVVVHVAGNAPPFTHDLDQLVRVVEAGGTPVPTEIAEHARSVPSGTWTRARYPDPATHFVPARDITEAEAEAIITHAKAVWQRAKEQL